MPPALSHSGREFDFHPLTAGGDNNFQQASRRRGPHRQINAIFSARAPSGKVKLVDVQSRASDGIQDETSGKYAGQITVFDKVGQVEDSSKVLPINGSWTTQTDKGIQPRPKATLWDEWWKPSNLITD